MALRAARRAGRSTAATQVYFGLAGTNLEDDERTIPFFQAERERFLEFDLTKLVYELVQPETHQRRRDVVAADGRRSAGDDDDAGARAGRAALCLDGAAAADQHGEDGAARRAGDRPGHPGAAGGRGAEPVADATLYAIDQFVMRGGKLMAMVDPWSEALAADALADRHAADGHVIGPEEAVRRLGHRVRSDQGGRRPDRRVARARRRRRRGAGGRTMSRGSTSATASIMTTRRRPTCSR